MEIAGQCLLTLLVLHLQDKMAVMECVVFLLASFACLEGAKLPHYITACSLSDPNLNECAIKHGQAAIPTIVKGDSKYRIPNMLPLRIPEIKFSSGELNIRLANADIYGLEDVQIKDMDIDLKKQHVVITVAIPVANLLSDYDINGRILILPMKGKGPTNITFVGGEYKYQFDYILTEKNGEEYGQLINDKLDYTTKRSHFHFENLFGGDKTLGTQMNQFLDENWKDVEQDIGPALSQTIDTIITSTIKGIFSKVPFKYLFLP